MHSDFLGEKKSHGRFYIQSRMTKQPLAAHGLVLCDELLICAYR